MDYDSWIPLLVAIFGGVGVKVIEGFISKSGKKIDMEAEIRKELRDVVAAQDDKIIALNKEVDGWRDKYYKVIEDLIGYKELQLGHRELQTAYDKLKELFEELKKEKGNTDKK